MRIVAGQLRGRRLAGPRESHVRPTSDALRETLFNILDVPPAARILDAFAGTGALGLEAISRGGASVTFVERDREALGVIRQNVQACGVDDRVTCVRADFIRERVRGGRPAWAETPFDVVLLDPPYDVEDLAAVLGAAAACLAEGGQIALEHRRSREAPVRVGDLRRVRTVAAGDSALSFYHLMPTEET